MKKNGENGKKERKMKRNLVSHAKSSTISNVYRCCCNFYRQKNPRRFPGFTVVVVTFFVKKSSTMSMILFRNVSLSRGKSTTRFGVSPFFRRKVTDGAQEPQQEKQQQDMDSSRFHAHTASNAQHGHGTRHKIKTNVPLDKCSAVGCWCPAGCPRGALLPPSLPPLLKGPIFSPFFLRGGKGRGWVNPSPNPNSSAASSARLKTVGSS